MVKELTKNREYAEMAVQNSAIQSLQRVLQSVNDPEVLVPTVEAVTNIASSGSKMAATIGSTAGTGQTKKDDLICLYSSPLTA